MEGCGYGRVNRTLIEGLKETVEKGFKDIDTKITTLFNHQSTHIPQETVTKINFQWKLIAFLASMLAGIMGIIGTAAVNHFF